MFSVAIALLTPAVLPVVNLPVEELLRAAPGARRICAKGMTGAILWAVVIKCVSMCSISLAGISHPDMLCKIAWDLMTWLQGIPRAGEGV